MPDAAAPIGVLLDLDGTLVRSEGLEVARRSRDWSTVYRMFGETRLPDGTASFIKRVARMGKVGVVTSSPRRYAESLLEHHGLPVPVVVAYHDTTRHKPDPAPLLEAAKHLGVIPGRCVHVGDSRTDDEAARRAGMGSIVVGWSSSGTVPGGTGVCRTWQAVLEQVHLQGVDGLVPPPVEWVYETAATQPARSGRYPARALVPRIIASWSGDDFHLLAYRPKRSSETPDVASRLILDFKRGIPEAEAVMAELVTMALQTHEAEFLRRRCEYIVPLPSSQANRVSGSMQRLVQSITRNVEWLTPLAALRRHTGVQKSATAAPGERPTEATHRASIEWVGPPLRLAGRSVLIMDDVMTTGATARAARSIIRDATHASAVLGFFLARTRYD